MTLRGDGSRSTGTLYLGCTVRSVRAVNVVHATKKCRRPNRIIAVCQKYINIGV